jgi:hypothetical protein
MVQKARIELRCTDADREAFEKARVRDGDDTTSAWLRRVGRLAARVAAVTASLVVNASALVKPQ